MKTRRADPSRLGRRVKGRDQERRGSSTDVALGLTKVRSLPRAGVARGLDDATGRIEGLFYI